MRQIAPAVAKKVYGRRDHLVPRPDVQGQEGKQEGIGARGTADAGSGAAVVGHLGLESRDLRPEHEHLAFEDLADNRLDLIADRLVLRLQIQGGDTDWFVCDAHRRSLL